MARRRRPEPSAFNRGTLINIFAIPVLTVGAGVLAFYFTVPDKIAQLQEQQKTESKAREVVMKEESAQREKLRDALLGYMEETRKGNEETRKEISVINQHAAVADEQIKTVNATMERIVNGLQRLETSSNARNR